MPGYQEFCKEMRRDDDQIRLKTSSRPIRWFILLLSTPVGLIRAISPFTSRSKRFGSFAAQKRRYARRHRVLQPKAPRRFDVGQGEIHRESLS
jgi:hypothetical protein